MTAPAARWSLRLLGGFALSDGTQRHGKLGTRAAIALLARLSLQPKAAHPREALVELLWPGVAADAGRQRLRQTLSTLKQVLEPAREPGFAVIEADRLSLRLVPGSVWCDATAFEAAYKSGDHDDARTLYLGELLPGFFDEWISDERLRLEGLFDRLRAPAAPPLAASHASPTSPAPPTASAAAATGPQRAPLPAYLTRLIGADPQAAHLRQQVAANRLVTLMGPGGTGKTRMAVEVAQSLAAGDAGVNSFELVVFVPLAACRSRQELLDQLLLSLHLPQGKAGALDAAVQALDGRRALLVLDNVEQVVDDGAEAIGALGMRLPLLHLLVTSRRALAVDGEQEVTVAALALPDSSATLADAAANPAVSLFIDRARAARAEFHLHDGNRAAVIELVQLLDGMPLAIELAAARVRSLAPAEMAATLRLARDGHADASALDLLARAPQRGRQDTRHRSMQDTIDWSWQLLAPELRALLAALTVFQGGFTASAAAAVCAVTKPAAMPLQLDELLSHSLLRAQAGVGTDGALRFSLYEPIREFAQRTLDAAASTALRQRHRAWAIAWAQTMPVTPSLPALHTEMPNLVAAMSSGASDGDPDAVINLVLALAPALEEISLPGAAVAAMEQAVAACADSLLKSRGLSALGRLQFRAGRGAESRQSFERSVADAPAGQPDVRARSLYGLAMMDFNAVAKGTAPLAMLDEARVLAESAGDPLLVALIDRLSADVLGHRGRDFVRAVALQQRALAVWQAHGDRLATLRCSYQLAQLALGARQLDAVLQQVAPLIAEAQAMQAWHTMAQCLTLRGLALERLRRWPAACADLAAALRIAWQSLDTWDMARAMGSLMRPLVRARQPDRAARLAGFISVFWVQRFSPLHPQQVSGLRRVRRLAALQMGTAASNAACAQGERLSVAQAVALALAAPGA